MAPATSAIDNWAARFPYSRVNPSLHLVYLCGEYPPASHGGIGIFTRAMAHAMVARGHTVTVLGVQRGLGAVHDERSAPASLSGGPHE